MNRPGNFSKSRRIYFSLICFSFLLCFGACKLKQADQSDIKFQGHDNQRAKIVFKGHVLTDLRAETFPQNSDFLHSIIHTQVKHLMGEFKSHKAFASHKGIVFGKPDYKVLRTHSEVRDGKNYLKIHYQFEDIGVFHKNLFSSGKLQKKTIVLPEIISLTKIRRTDKNGEVTIKPLVHARSLYEAGIVPDKTETKDRLPCTNRNYSSRGDYWYFWNLDNPNCPSATKQETVEFEATFVAMPNDFGTYPEYQRLGTKDLLKIYIARGVDHDFSEDDIGVFSFFRHIDKFERSGFKPTTTVNKEMRSITMIYNQPINQNQQRRIELHMELLDQKSSEFTQFVKKAFQDADIFVYSGHSGLGGYLKPSKFNNQSSKPAKIDFANKYQIFLFNGCSTYAYYNRQYFEAKPEGSKNLDIVSSGLGTQTPSSYWRNYTLVNNLISLEWPNWEKIMQDIYTLPENWSKTPSGGKSIWDNDAKSSLYHVNGDEDNPRKKDQVIPTWAR